MLLFHPRPTSQLSALTLPHPPELSYNFMEAALMHDRYVVPKDQSGFIYVEIIDSCQSTMPALIMWISTTMKSKSRQTHILRDKRIQKTASSVKSFQHDVKKVKLAFFRDTRTLNFFKSPHKSEQTSLVKFLRSTTFTLKLVLVILSG